MFRKGGCSVHNLELTRGTVNKFSKTVNEIIQCIDFGPTDKMFQKYYPACGTQIR